MEPLHRTFHTQEQIELLTSRQGPQEEFLHALPLSRMLPLNV